VPASFYVFLKSLFSIRLSLNLLLTTEHDGYNMLKSNDIYVVDKISFI